MRKLLLTTLFISTLFSCNKSVETLKPTVEAISESVYASGIVESKNQYQVYSTVNGIVNELLVKEGDLIKKGANILTITNQASSLNLANAKLAAEFSDYNANISKLEELKINIDLAKSKLANDSLLFTRQKNLWSQNVGSKVELEQKELMYKNSKTAYQSALLKYEDLKKQIVFSSKQSKNNLKLSQEMRNDFSIKSDISGKVYSIMKEKGELVSPQTPIAIIGDDKVFVLELQIDEYDIVKLVPGQKIIVTLDSYKGEIFEAVLDRIDPIMNERSKTFTTYGVFVKQPPVLYPNLTVEANIVIRTKSKVLTLPRNYLTKDGYVMNVKGEKIKVTEGVKDFQKVEIVSGITADTELIKPVE